METRQKLDTALKEAIRSNDEMRKQNVRMIMSAVKLSEVDKGARLDEAEVLGIIQKELKSRQESRQDAERANRPDLIQKAESEILFLETFLPKQLTEEELAALVRETIGEVGAGGPSDVGKVMKAVLPKIQGRATGSQVNQAVRKLLQP
jgi:uncharacterized protein YqeY